MFALLFAAIALAALLMIADALRTMLYGARVLWGPQGLAGQVHYRTVTVRRTVAAITCPRADRPQGQRLRALPMQRRARHVPMASPARSAAA